MDVMISINPPYTEMIMSGYKDLEFRKTILNDMKYKRVYIYETKNKGGIGKIIGEGLVVVVARKETAIDFVLNYHDKKYLKKIGCIDENGHFTNWNYAIRLRGVRRYDKPRELSEFLNSKYMIMKQPPQNMCYCVLRSNFDEQ